MRIGVPREIKVHEYRVGLVPAGVRELVAAGRLGRKTGWGVNVEQLIEKLIDAEHPKTLLLKFAYNGRQQAVIATCTVTDSGEQLGGPPVRAQGAERWAPDTAG